LKIKDEHHHIFSIGNYGIMKENISETRNLIELLELAVVSNLNSKLIVVC